MLLKSTSPFLSKIIDFHYSGLGVAIHPNGKRFFVPCACLNDHGLFEITEEKKKHGFATLKKLITASSDRTQPLCPLHGFSKHHCGGCPWLFMRYEAQVFFKKKLIKNQFQRHSILAPDIFKILPVLPAKTTLAYRRRFHVKTDGKKLGFLAFRSNTLIDVLKCPMLHPTCQKLLSALRNSLSFLPSPHPTSPQHSTSSRHSHHLLRLPPFSFIERDIETPSSDPIFLNQKRPFFQNHLEQNQNMQQWVLNKTAKLQGKLLELFCGNGNFTKLFAQNKKLSITAIDNCSDSLKKLSKNLPYIKCFKKDLYQKNNLSYIQTNFKNTDILFLNPPRSGWIFLKTFIKKLLNLKYLFYISCAPRTLCRDIALLKNQDTKWKILEIQPMDAYPHTSHVETLVFLKKASHI